MNLIGPHPLKHVSSGSWPLKNYDSKLIAILYFVYPSTLKCNIFGHLVMSSFNDMDWNQVLKKEARGIEDADLGEVQEIREDNVITKAGLIDKVTYSIPKSFVDAFDGHTLRFKITKEEAETQFKIKDEVWL